MTETDTKWSTKIGKYTYDERDVFGRAPLTTLGTLKMYLGYLLVVPIRLALLIPFHLVMVGLIGLSLIGTGDEGATGCRRSIFEALVYVWMRGNLFLFGFYYIPTTGKRSVPDGSYVVIGNHVGWMEVGYMFGTYAPSFVAKSSIKNLPIFGSIAVANRTIFIDRFATNKGFSVTDQIVNRLKTGGKVGMFPEGTTSNGTSILKFRTGAFVAGTPVVPMVFKYPYCSWDMPFSSVSLKWHILGTLAQGINFMTVEYLPVYYPSEAEKADPKLYAGNVKKVMIEASGLADSSKDYNDKLRWEKDVGYLNKELAAKMKKDQANAGEVNMANSPMQEANRV